MMIEMSSQRRIRMIADWMGPLLIEESDLDRLHFLCLSAIG